MKSFLKTLLVLVVFGALCGAGWLWYLKRNSGAAVTYRTAPIQRGDLMSTIGATGTLEPEEVVDVGAQVAGQILTFGPDPNNKGKLVDYNTEVVEGSILAQIDDSLYASDRDQNTAQLESSKANVAKAQADLGQSKAKFVQAERDWKRAKEAQKGVMSQADTDGFEAAYESARANVTSAEAGVTLAQKNVTSAEASLKRSVRNLSYCTIKSPVKGVIIDRRVNIGQTVVSSLNAPSLFLIAKDLTKMQIWASVNEADIGNIHPDQAVTFTVDAAPDRVFQGKVGKIRLNATTTQNVVTYTVEINTDNSDRALKPYLTANVQFEVAKHDDVWMVPNIALRWMPTQPTQVSPETLASMNEKGKSAGSSTGKAPGPTTRRSDTKARNHGTIWVEEGSYAKPIKVKLGITDGTNTEVSASELKEGMFVITGEVRADEAGSGDAKNPFMPQFNRGGRRGG